MRLAALAPEPGSIVPEADLFDQRKLVSVLGNAVAAVVNAAPVQYSQDC